MADSTEAPTPDDMTTRGPGADPEVGRCQALTKSGRPCPLRSEPGSDYCAVHRPPAGGDEQVPPEDEIRRLVAEVEDLTRRLETLAGGTGARSLAFRGARRLRSMLAEAGHHVRSAGSAASLERFGGVIKSEWFDRETWKGTWYMINYLLKYQGDMLKRRFTGDYETDEWGLDWEYVDAMRPLLNLAYKAYWRVEATGVEHIPVAGRALLVGNHSGRLPWDGWMVGVAVLREHPAQRLVRTLHAPWVVEVPFLSHMAVKLGQALATLENGTGLLERDELVAVFPEGDKLADIPYRERYRLERFDSIDFVTMALVTGAPIVPVSVVGAADSQVGLALSSFTARGAGRPRFPISGSAGGAGNPSHAGRESGGSAARSGWRPLDLIALPTKWYIDIGEPLPTEQYGPEAVGNAMLASQIGDQVRNIVQGMVSDRLAQRRSAFR